jgi:hypothetical protein
MEKNRRLSDRVPPMQIPTSTIIFRMTGLRP